MIVIENLTKAYDSRHAIDRLSLTVPDHAKLAVLGPSGSGKTTLLRLIAGIEQPDTGTITMDNRLVSSPQCMVPPCERSIGFVFQSGALWPHMTVAENIRFALHDRPAAGQDERIRFLLDRTGIADLADRYPGQISGGEARRAALARALAPQPATLLFDEPLTNLDRGLRVDLMDLILESVRGSDAAMIFVTHDEDEALAIGGSVIRLDRGSLSSGGI